MKIGICDTGIDRTHPELGKNISEISWDAVSHQNPPVALISHGTAVAGIMGAIGKNMRGMAHPVELIDLKCMATKADHANPYKGINDFFVECLDQAIEQHLPILNCSFSTKSFSGEVKDALKRAQKAKMILVVAAGNARAGEEPIDYDKQKEDGRIEKQLYLASYKYGYDTFSPIGRPKLEFDNMVVVAATQYGSDGIAPFSHFGTTTVDIGAPGKDIFSTRLYSRWDPRPLSWKGYDWHTGTSFAAPQVAAALALLKTQFPDDDYQSLIRRLLDNADVVNNLRGFINNNRRLNIKRALEAAAATSEKEIILDDTDTTEEVTPESSSPTREAVSASSEDEKEDV